MTYDAYRLIASSQGLSYRQLEWKTAADLEARGKAARTMLNKTVKKAEQKEADARASAATSALAGTTSMLPLALLTDSNGMCMALNVCCDYILA